jgi:hypothetical protein
MMLEQIRKKFISKTELTKKQPFVILSPRLQKLIQASY